MVTAVNGTSDLWTTRLAYFGEAGSFSEDLDPGEIGPDCCWYIVVCCWVVC